MCHLKTENEALIIACKLLIIFPKGFILYWPNGDIARLIIYGNELFNSDELFIEQKRNEIHLLTLLVCMEVLIHESRSAWMPSHIEVHL